MREIRVIVGRKKMESEGKRERERGEDDLITIAHSVNHLSLKNMKIATRQEKPDQL